MHVIDANTSFGRRVSDDARYRPDALLAELDAHRIACALTISLRGLEYDPAGGNAETLALARRRPHLIPMGTLDPRAPLGWEQEVDRCLAAGVRVWRFFPGAQGWPVGSAAFRRILDRLGREDACLVFSVSEGYADWRLIDEIAKATRAAGQPVILADAYYANMAELMAVMQDHPHLYAETNGFATRGAVAVMVGAVGAGRLLFGSKAPERPIQKALNEVLEADVSDEDKRAILGGNAARLLGIGPAHMAGRPQLDSLEPVRFEEPIVDVHAHLGFWRYPIPDEGHDPAGTLARMRRLGVARSILSSYESMRYDVAAGNAAVARAIAGHPELLGYVELNPYQFELSCAEMERYYALPGFVGCEIELSHIPCPMLDPRMLRLMAEVARWGRPVLLLPGAGGPQAERELARMQPALTIIHAHGFDRDWARVVADAPNVCVEHNYSRPSHHGLRDSVDVLGPERVLFGSDHNFLSLGASVGLYWDAGLSAEERRLVLHENARRLFRLGR